jgi:hypothetical protein
LSLCCICHFQLGRLRVGRLGAINFLHVCLEYPSDMHAQDRHICTDYGSPYLPVSACISEINKDICLFLTSHIHARTGPYTRIMGVHICVYQHVSSFIIPGIPAHITRLPHGQSLGEADCHFFRSTRQHSHSASLLQPEQAQPP